MADIAAFFQANLIPIYFVYGLVMFITGFAVALESGRASQLRLTRALPYLGAFGLTQGIYIWVEMLSMISAEIPTVAREPEWAEIVKVSWMALSFFCLFQFGVRLIDQLLPRYNKWLRWLPPLSIVVFLAGVLLIQGLRGYTFMQQTALVDMWGHYSIGMPATILAVLAMLAQRRAFVRDNMAQFGGD